MERGRQVCRFEVVVWSLRTTRGLNLSATYFGERPGQRIPALNQPRVRVAPGHQREPARLAPDRDHALRRPETQFTPVIGRIFVRKGQLAVDHAALNWIAALGEQGADGRPCRDLLRCVGDILLHTDGRSPVALSEKGT